MSLRLFEVRVTHTLYILADGMRDAVDAAPGYIRDEIGDPECDSAEVTSAEGLSLDVLGGVPHGCGGYTKVPETTVARVLGVETCAECGLPRPPLIGGRCAECRAEAVAE